jgi:excisionase family DNA binding protein
MFDQNFIERLAQALAARIAPQMQKGNGASQLPRLLTAAQAARYLGRKSPQSLYHLVARREIPYVKHGRNLRFDRLELDRWIQEDKIA